MSSFRKSTPAKPDVVTIDTVVPLHSFDDNDVTRGSLLYITLCFDGKLDAENIRQSMEVLMQIGDWRKLGARLRKTDGNKLEYHIPSAFTEQRPGFVFTQAEHRESIKDHPLASRLPRPSLGQPSVQSDPRDFITLCRRPDGPKKLEDFLTSDEPQMSLHVEEFDDATLLSVSWLHTLCDATAMSDTLKSLVLILRDRQSEVPRVSPISVDPLATLGSSQSEPYVNENRQLIGFGLVVFFIRFFVKLMWYRNSQRIIYLPPDYIRALKVTTLKELQDPNVRLSEGDILSALLTRLALRNASPSSNQNITIWNVLDVREPLASTLLPPSSGVYLGNAVLGIIAFVPAHQVLTKSLSVAASYIRRAIEEQRTPAQIHALAATSKKAKEAGRPCLFGDAQSRLFFYSNWAKAGFFKLDFSAAKVGVAAPHEAAMFPFAVLFNSEAQHPIKTNTIIGQDATGGYWIEFNMEDGNWNGAQEMLDEFHIDATTA